MFYADTNIRKDIVQYALEQKGKPYIHGMHGPDSFDCAGFVWYVYNNVLGIDIYSGGFGLSTTTRIMTGSYGKLILFDELSMCKDISLIKKGDIVLLHRQSIIDTEPKENNKYPGHCGLYIGDNRFLHCSSSKGKVIISNFEKNERWKKILIGSKDVISDEKVLQKVLKICQK